MNGMEGKGIEAGARARGLPNCVHRYWRSNVRGLDPSFDTTMRLLRSPSTPTTYLVLTTNPLIIIVFFHAGLASFDHLN